MKLLVLVLPLVKEAEYTIGLPFLGMVFFFFFLLKSVRESALTTRLETLLPFWRCLQQDFNTWSLNCLIAIHIHETMESMTHVN